MKSKFLPLSVMPHLNRMRPDPVSSHSLFGSRGSRCMGPFSSLKHTKHVVFSECVFPLFPLLQVLFPLISTWLPHPHGSGLSLNIVPSERPSLTSPQKAASHHLSISHQPTVLYSIYHVTSFAYMLIAFQNYNERSMRTVTMFLIHCQVSSIQKSPWDIVGMQYMFEE